MTGRNPSPEFEPSHHGTWLQSPPTAFKRLLLRPLGRRDRRKGTRLWADRPLGSLRRSPTGQAQSRADLSQSISADSLPRSTKINPSGATQVNVDDQDAPSANADPRRGLQGLAIASSGCLTLTIVGFFVWGAWVSAAMCEPAPCHGMPTLSNIMDVLQWVGTPLMVTLYLIIRPRHQRLALTAATFAGLGLLSMAIRVILFGV